MAPTENRLSIGYDLEIVDDDDNESDNVTVTTPHTSIDPTLQVELAAPPSTYLRQEHRSPSRYTDFAPLSSVTDGTSP